MPSHSMRFAFLTLIGFSLTTVCASLCPMNMGIPMNHDMQMMAQDMPMNHDAGEMPCEICEQTGQELAVVSPITINAPTGIISAILPVDLLLHESNYIQKTRLPFSNVGPPSPEDSLVGTVVLRT